VTDLRRLANPGTDAFQVSKYPFFQLNRLASRYNAVIEARLRAVGIDIPTWRVLMVLGEQRPRSIGSISEAAVINPSTLTRILQRMSAAGLVSSQAHPDDNRVTEVDLTAKGQEKLAEARQTTAPVYLRAIDGFAEAEFGRLIEMLERMFHNLGDGPVNGR